MRHRHRRRRPTSARSRSTPAWSTSSPTCPGTLREATAGRELLDATFPPGSVTGAPKSSALRIIARLETGPRGPYCGAVGWVDADRGEAELAVGIRTFWIERDDAGRRVLRFGTGAGITWGSDPEGEWARDRAQGGATARDSVGRRAPACEGVRDD